MPAQETAPAPIPWQRFGRDHWSALLYAESVAVDNRGRPDYRKMRVDLDRHPHRAHIYADSAERRKYPTRLIDGEIFDHDDWDCIDDLAAAGLMRDGGFTHNPIWRLTPAGEQVAAALRSYRNRGGRRLADFQVDPEVMAAAAIPAPAQCADGDDCADPQCPAWQQARDAALAALRQE